MRSLLSVVFGLWLTQTVAAGAPPVTRPTTDATLVRATSKAIGLSFALPKGWRTQDVGPTKGEDGIEFRILRFSNIDEASTVLGISRIEKPLGAADPLAHAKSEIDHHRSASTSHGAKVKEERDVTVAGAPGRLLEVAMDVSGQPMTLLVVCFVLDDREYKLTMIGQRDFVNDIRPSVTRLIDSLERAPASGKKE